MLRAYVRAYDFDAFFRAQSKNEIQPSFLRLFIEKTIRLTNTQLRKLQLEKESEKICVLCQFSILYDVRNSKIQWSRNLSNHNVKRERQKKTRVRNRLKNGLFNIDDTKSRAQRTASIPPIAPRISACTHRTSTVEPESIQLRVQ